MNITLNGRNYSLKEPVSVQGLVDLLGLEKSQVAIELNRTIVSRSRYADVLIQAGDELEIVTFIGGG
jgi:thiamine biosynthesis protein ThiS